MPLWRQSLKIFCGVVSAAMLTSGAALAAIDTPASHAVIYDYDSGEVLYCKNCDERMPPSSMSKLMTVELLFQRLKDGRLKLTDTFHVTENAWRQGLQSNESRMFLDLNSDVPIDDLLKGIIVQSGGDACVVVAESIGGSESGFADLENKRAKEIGLTQSHFANSSGMPDPEQYMSAHDLARLAAHLVHDYPQYYPYFAIRDFTWNKDAKGKPITQANRNRLLGSDGVDGLKTGHTDAGGYGMVSSAMRQGRRIITVVNGLTSDNERTSESRRLLDIGFRDFKHYTLLDAGAVVGEAAVFGSSEKTVPLQVKEAVAMTMSPDSRTDMKATIKYTGPVKAPIVAGQQIGTLTITVPGTPDKTVPVYATKAVSSSGIFAKMIAGMKALISGKPD
jgi:D-alanyl-D-alanine carboxypeptidase (penicillin-binding protein 5/6)